MNKKQVVKDVMKKHFTEKLPKIVEEAEIVKGNYFEEKVSSLLKEVRVDVKSRLGGAVTEGEIRSLVIEEFENFAQKFHEGVEAYKETHEL